MEWAAAFGIAVFAAFVGVFAFGFGCFCGGAVSLWCAREFKRDASAAVDAAAARAYADHLAELNRTLQEKRAIDRSDIPLSPQEKQDQFEEGLSSLYPDDPALQEEARKQREVRKMAGR